jgi:hypothetical protein
MPGIIGFFSDSEPDSQVGQQEATGQIRALLDSLSTVVRGLDTQGSLMAILERENGPSAGSFHRDDGILFTLYGHCMDPRSHSALDASALHQLWRDEGEAALGRLEGAFHAARYEEQSGRLTIFNDRVGILPFYWHIEDGLFSFGSRLRFLARSPDSWTPDPGAVIGFLSVGHYLGPSTQIREANFLTPATILEVDTRTMEVSQRRYWNLVYDPDHSLSTKEHARRLGEAILESVDLLTLPATGTPGIFLSGGWDSRSLLGVSLKLDRPPHLVVTNGVSDEIRFADTWLAKRMARDLDLPYRFCRRVPDIGEEMWLDGIHSGEITTANNPESFGQHQLGPEMFAEIDYILKGDVTWGSGDRAPTRELSIGKIVPYPLMDNVKAVLAGDLAETADDLYEEQIGGVMDHCQNTDWTDRRDYLWQMGGINRYILGLGISDEQHIQVRRPLLSGKVFDVYTKVPQNLRVLKNLFIQTIHDNFPALFAYGRNHTSNIAHYYAFMADFVRRRTLEHLDAGHDLGGLLDRDACRLVIEGFHPTHSKPWIPGWKSQQYNRIHDRYSYHWHRTRFYSEKDIKSFKTSSTMLAFHIYLLLEWFHGEEPHAG